MEIIESASGVMSGSKATKFIKFKFDKGCWMVRSETGRESFHQKNNHACRAGSAMITEMCAAVAKRFPNLK